MNVTRMESLDSACRFLEENPKAVIVAGGTDLIPRLNQKIESRERLCYLDNLKDLRGIKEEEGGCIFIGALIRLVELSESPFLSNYTAMIKAASKVASPQIRNQATIGGNILQENRCMYFNQAVPWSEINLCYKRGGDKCYQHKNSKECMALFQSDIAPVLIAYGAKAFIYSNDGSREILVSDLYLPAGKKNIGHAEILLGIKLPPFSGHCLSSYVRKTIRGSFDFPIISCAVFVREENNSIVDIAVVLGSAGVMPAYIKEIPLSFIGKQVSELPQLALRVLDTVAKHVAPFRDTRVNTSVRKDMAKIVFIEAMNEIASQN
jgi:CO/xanthine dehydrogenase FAD-binding subunit